MEIDAKLFTSAGNKPRGWTEQPSEDNKLLQPKDI